MTNVILVICVNDFPILLKCLEELFMFNQIRSVLTNDAREKIHEILKYVNIVQLEKILVTRPESDITIIKCLDQKTQKAKIYAWWKKNKIVPTSLKEDQWLNTMRRVKNQGNHEACWALVSTELVSAVRYIKGHDKVRMEYSIQDVVDFTNPEERSRLKKDTQHYCYPCSIYSGLEYVKNFGVQREEDRPYRVDSCTRNVAPRDPLSKLSYISEVKCLGAIEDALTVLHEHPVAAVIPIFEPEYSNIENKIYRGPTTSSSVITGMHAVNIIGAYEENGEKYVYVRSSHGENIGINGNLKVSIEVMMMCLTPDIEKEFGKDPQSLIDGFVYPETSPDSAIIDVDPPEQCIINIF